MDGDFVFNVDPLQFYGFQERLKLFENATDPITKCSYARELIGELEMTANKNNSASECCKEISRHYNHELATSLPKAYQQDLHKYVKTQLQKKPFEIEKPTTWQVTSTQPKISASIFKDLFPSKPDQSSQTRPTQPRRMPYNQKIKNEMHSTSHTNRSNQPMPYRSNQGTSNGRMNGSAPKGPRQVKSTLPAKDYRNRPKRNIYYGAQPSASSYDVEMAEAHDNTNYSAPRHQNNNYSAPKSAPPQPEKESKPSFTSGYNKLREDDAKNGTVRKPPKRRRGFKTPFKRDEEDDEPAAKKQKFNDPTDDPEYPAYKNLDPAAVGRVLSEIVVSAPNVRFKDIAGLSDVKSALADMIIHPAANPELYTGLYSPPRGLLLFGPPGNGKTLIAKAVATEADLTFFCISAGSLMSKWIGEGEKMVKALFGVARAKQPSFIFIDEIDSILCVRSSDENEGERRMKTEFLSAFDGASSSSDDSVTVMGATNRPQDLDEAARRRMTRRIYVPLPTVETRIHLIKHMLTKHGANFDLTDEDFVEIAETATGYSGADLALLSREAAMVSLREAREDPNVDASIMSKDQLRPISVSDFKKTIASMRPSVAPEECDQYDDWNKKFGTSKTI